MGENPIFGSFLIFFAHISASNFHKRNKLNIIYHLPKTACPGIVCFCRYSRDQTHIFEFFGIFGVLSHYVSNDALIWTAWKVDRMYSIYSYLEIKDNFFKKIILRGIN